MRGQHPELHGQRQDQAILGEIARIDAPLSNRIQDLMFVFDDLVDLDDREMQLVLREVSGERLGLPCAAPTSGARQDHPQHVAAR